MDAKGNGKDEGGEGGAMRDTVLQEYYVQNFRRKSIGIKIKFVGFKERDGHVVANYCFRSAALSIKLASLMSRMESPLQS